MRLRLFYIDNVYTVQITGDTLQYLMIYPSAGLNACANQPCSLLCLPQPGQRHTCVCPEGTPTTTLPSGEVQCQCPTGYQRHNNTCVKQSESR